MLNLELKMNDPNPPITPKQPDDSLDSSAPINISGPDEDQMIYETEEAINDFSKALESGKFKINPPPQS